jgi:DinB family protein
MSTITIDQKTVNGIATRILREGYGKGAWHGPDLKAALADVTPELAYWRPASGRHNIAEIAVHHAYTTHGVRAKLGADVEPFMLAGEDWFDVPDSSTLPWPTILGLVALEQQKLDATIRNADASGGSSQTDSERFDLVLGITCHAVYHAGQIQLIKRLATP